MSFIAWDPDEWERVTTSEQWGFYPGTMISHGSVGLSQKRRAPEEVARIKAERKRMEEDAILERADRIRAARG